MFNGKLYRRVYDSQNLNQAWNKVRTNKGMSGMDDMSVIQFNAMLFDNLTNLQVLLKKKVYRPQPVKRFNMKKSDGGVRELGILTIEDRVAQRSVMQVIEPLFDRTFSPASFGFRKGRSVQDAVEQIIRHYNRNFLWVVDADIMDFFPTINHRILMKLVRKVIDDGDILKLMEKWLDLGVAGFDTSHGVTNGGKSAKIGLLQGSPLSPLLANVYLDPFDKAVSKKGFQLVRYGDDFIIQCRDKKEAENALKYVRKVLNNLKLTLHPHKTQIAHFDKGIRFLGYALRSYKDHKGKSLKAVPLKPLTPNDVPNTTDISPETWTGVEAV